METNTTANTNEQTFSRLDEFIVVKTLGKGAYAKVKLVKDEQGNQFAAKIMTPNNTDQMQRFKSMAQNEVALVQQINHPNVVKIYRCIENGLYVKKNGDIKNVMYILMEFCAGGQVFDFLFQTGAFSEEITRSYFQQLISAVEAVHNAGITHRDLKPDNLLLDKDFNLKVADFGFAIVLSGRDGSGMLKTHIGSEAYMAPEIHESKAYIGRQIDLFACGIILFILKNKNPPWRQAAMIDPYFKIFSGTDSNRFWEAHCKKKNPNFFSAAFKNLIHCMCSYEPTERLTISEIKSHPYWIEGKVASQEQIMTELRLRQNRVIETIEKIKQEKQSKGFHAGYGRTAYGTGRIFRSVGQGEQSSLMAMSLDQSDQGYEYSGSLSNSQQSDCSQPVRLLQKYSKGGFKWTQFATLQDKDGVFDALESWVSKNTLGLDYKIFENTYKIVATIPQKDSQNVELQIKLYQYENRTIVDFVKLAGNTFAFNTVYSNILDSSEVSDLVDGVPISEAF